MSVVSSKNVIRQRPRLLYAYSHGGDGYITQAAAPENTEIILAASGSGKCEIDGSVYPFAAGDLIVINKGCAHRESFDECESKELIYLGVGNLRLYGFAPDSLLKDREFCLVHTEGYFNSLLTHARQLIAEHESDLPLKDAVCEHLLKTVTLLTVRLVSFSNLTDINQNASFAAAKEYFDEHFLEIENVDAVCRRLYVNKYYLTHLFTQNAGMPPIRYVITKRIELACRYLETTDDNVADIGKRCGYPDAAYFCRTFKKVKKVTPLRYRYLFKEKQKKEEKKN